MRECKTLITGHCGFIGSHFKDLLIENGRESDSIIGVDCLTYAADPSRAANLRWSYKDNLADPNGLYKIFNDHNIFNIVHFAASTHVDRSIKGPQEFVYSNFVGTFNLLEAARFSKELVRKIVIVSTDEIFGSVDRSVAEGAVINPSSPYSASKAAADLLAMSYYKTFGLPIVISRCSNNYGPRQYPEKLIPMAIGKALRDEVIPLYGDGSNIRDWIHVSDHCRAIMDILNHGVIGQTYNVGSGNLRSNLSVIEEIIGIVGKGRYEFVKDRPGHDFRYQLDSSKIRRELGWRAQVGFEAGLKETVEWYQKSGSPETNPGSLLPQDPAALVGRCRGEEPNHPTNEVIISATR